jgi:hypothetical protein
MSSAATTERSGRAMRRRGTGRTTGRALLWVGIGAVVLYAVGDVLSGLVYDGYSFRTQAISELTAYGSPVRPLMLAFMAVHGVLMAAFSLGIVLAAERNRALRWSGILLLASAVGTLPLHPFFPMSSRWMERGPNDTMHLLLTMVFSACVLAAVACSAVAFRGWFRIYAWATLAVLISFGWLAGQAAPEIEKHLPTPWLGASERVNAYAYFAWIVVLALVLLRRPRDTNGQPDHVQSRTSGMSSSASTT